MIRKQCPILVVVADNGNTKKEDQRIAFAPVNVM